MLEGIITRAIFRTWLENLIKSDREVRAPLPKGMKNFKFCRLDKSEDFTWNYLPTIAPPKKFLFPPEEVLYRYKKGGEEVASVTNSEPRILFGLRSCDLKAISLLDHAFSMKHRDPNYFARRRNTLLVGVECFEPCDQQAFCHQTGSLTHNENADVWLSLFTEERIMVRFSSEEVKKQIGQGLEKWSPVTESDRKYLKFKEDGRARKFPRRFNKSVDEIKKSLETSMASVVWETCSAPCLSCGTCNVVCPTCFCFDVRDEPDLDVNSGQKTRLWDACHLESFAQVGHGNFRSKPQDRLRHRINRKFNYLSGTGQGAFCTGCGRCGRQCTVNIDIYDVVNAL